MQEKKKYCINTVLLSKLNLIILFNPLYEILDRIECSQYLNRRVKREGYHITWYVHQTVTQNKLRRREGKQVRFENDVKFATAIDRSKCLIPNRTTNFTLRAHLFLSYHLLCVPCGSKQSVSQKYISHTSLSIVLVMYTVQCSYKVVSIVSMGGGGEERTLFICWGFPTQNLPPPPSEGKKGKGKRKKKIRKNMSKIGKRRKLQCYHLI